MSGLKKKKKGKILLIYCYCDFTHKKYAVIFYLHNAEVGIVIL